jgi:hypothetical protein
MASFTGRSSATPARRSPDGRKRSAPDSQADGDEPAVDPSVWIMLAEHVLSAGRNDQAEQLIEQAYCAYDKAMANAATSCSGAEKEEPEVDPE